MRREVSSLERRILEVLRTSLAFTIKFAYVILLYKYTASQNTRCFVKKLFPSRIAGSHVMMIIFPNLD